MNTFETKLDSLLKREKFIEDEGHYALIQLSKMFFDGDKGENLDTLLKGIDNRIQHDWVWSFIRFLDIIVSRNGDVLTQEEKDKIEQWSERHLEKRDGIPTTPLLKILDIFFSLKVSPEKEIKVLAPVIKNSSEYVILQSILLQINSNKKCDKLFKEVFLKTLSADRGNYIGVGYISKLYSRIGSSVELINFLVGLQKVEFKKALKDFFSMSDESGDALLKSIKNKKREIIHQIGSIFSELGRRGIWYGDNSHYVRDFLKKFLYFVNEGNISLFEEQNWLFQEDNFWSIYEIIAPFITFDDIQKYHAKIGVESMHIIRLYELIKHTNPGRSDKEEILKKIYKLDGFKKHYENCLKIWDKQTEEYKKSIEEYAQKEREEISQMIKKIERDKVMVGLIDKFYKWNKEDKKEKNPELFGEKEIKIVKRETKKFLEWNLFNFEIPVYGEDINEDGTKSFRGGFWYQIEFFKNVLDLWKNKFHGDLKPYRQKIIKSLLLVNTGEIKGILEIFGEDIQLDDNEAQMILSVLQKGHISKIRYHLSGQNIIDVLDIFSQKFKEKYPDETRELLWSILIDENYYDFGRVEAIDWARKNKLMDKNFIKIVKNYWKTLLAENENYIQNYNDENLIFGINRVLVEINDRASVLWRIEQLKTAKIILTEQDVENRHYGIASEVRWDKHLFKCLKSIKFTDYRKELYDLLKKGLDLIQEDENNSPKILSQYGRYLINNALELFPLDILVLKEAKKIIESYLGDALQYGGIIWRIKYQKLLDEVLQMEKINIDNEIVIKENGLTENERKGFTDQINQKDREIADLKKENSELLEYKKNTEEPENMVLIEGYTGVAHLENAWNILRPGKPIPFSLQDGFDADHMKKIISQDKPIGIYKNVIAIFDFDGKGLTRWSNCVSISETKKFSESDLNINHKECLYKECLYQPGSNRYVITLPFLDGFDQLPFDHRKSFLVGISGEHQHGVKIAIEELFFDFKKPTWIKDLISKGYFDESGNFTRVKGRKTKFINELQELISSGIVNPKDLYENFEPLLQKIEAIIAEPKSN